MFYDLSIFYIAIYFILAFSFTICRVSKDIDVIDINIPQTWRIFMGTMAIVISTMFVISFSTPMFIAALVPLFIFYLFAQVSTVCQF